VEYAAAAVAAAVAASAELLQALPACNRLTKVSQPFLLSLYLYMTPAWRLAPL
jgi:hypothetical protein